MQPRLSLPAGTLRAGRTLVLLSAGALCLAAPAQAQSASLEQQTLSQLRATTIALLDALERQQASAQRAAETAAQQAAEQQRVTTVALIEVLVSQGLLPRERAQALLQMATPPKPVAAAVAPAPAAPSGAAGAGGAQPTASSAAPAAAQWGDPPRAVAAAGAPIRVPYVSETVRAQIREEVRNDVLATVRDENWASPRLLPSWVRAVSLSGDTRVRAQFETLPDDNHAAELFRAQTTSPAWAPDIANTHIDRQRLTLRARLNAQAKIGDDVSSGLRLSTGSTSGPTSSSQTLGSGFNKSSVVIDRAWLRWEPLQDLRVWAGRFANPFFGTDLLWPDDMGLDGVAVQAERTLGNGVYAFAGAGAFALEEFNIDSRDKWLFGAQLGIDWSLGSNLNLRTALAIYDFRNVEGVRENQPPPTGGLAGTQAYFTSQYPASVRLKGNTLINLNDPTSTASPTWGLASSFRPINLSTALTLKPTATSQAGLSLDWVKNSAFDAAEISARAGVPLTDLLREKTTGMQVRAYAGTPQLSSRGDWRVFGAFRNFERDAWIDGFTDTTWHLGGTNYKGWTLGGNYAFDRNSSIGLRFTSTENLDDGYRSASGEATKSSAPLRIDLLQVDLNARF